MNSGKNNLAANLRVLRANSGLSQEKVAERVGVTRQAVAKWESASALPDILCCEALADLFGVSLDYLLRHDTAKTGLPIAPKDKHVFGAVTVGERGQVVLPKKARDTFGLCPGDTLIVLGDTGATAGIALVTSEAFLRMAGPDAHGLFLGKGGKE